jgi:hypothetical protein
LAARSSTFVDFDIIKHRVYAGLGGQSVLLQAPDEYLVRLIAPAALGHETIPDLDVVRGNLPTYGFSPSEDFILRRGWMLQDPHAKLVIFNAKVLAAPVIEGLTEIIDEICMQLPRGMQANLRDQAREINKAADGFIGAEETRDEGHGREDR